MTKGKGKGQGWHGDSRLHSLARKGIPTKIDKDKRFAVNNFVFRGQGNLINNIDDLKKIIDDNKSRDGFTLGFAVEDGSKVRRYEAQQGGIMEKFDNKPHISFPTDLSLDDIIDLFDKEGVGMVWIRPHGKSHLQTERTWAYYESYAGGERQFKTDEDVIDFLSEKDLSDLRRRQTITEQQLRMAYDQKNDNAIASLQIKDWHLTNAVFKKEFPEDYDGATPDTMVKWAKKELDLGEGEVDLRKLK